LLTTPADNVHTPDYVFALEHRGHVLIRQGDWKLVNTIVPFHPDNFELYDLSRDLAEQQNLKFSEPEKFQEMLRHWESFRRESRVQIPTPEAGTGH
jgi:arylsulfatase